MYYIVKNAFKCFDHSHCIWRFFVQIKVKFPKGNFADI